MNLGFAHTDSIELVYDQGIIEATICDDTILNMIEIPQLRPVMCKRIEMINGDGKVTIAEVK
ncbi:MULTISPECIES: hypothetical protein [unclassified Butyrivibrio]|uniref:hypothetical protein n=1 Tax=Butyrivibrio sp. LC3010 TaxID=1280680 RepID=UPI00041663BB|nr:MULTISPECIES: hypothetical protein [unclassified Butyrivibrio]